MKTTTKRTLKASLAYILTLMMLLGMMPLSAIALDEDHDALAPLSEPLDGAIAATGEAASNIVNASENPTEVPATSDTDKSAADSDGEESDDPAAGDDDSGDAGLGDDGSEDTDTEKSDAGDPDDTTAGSGDPDPRVAVL